jgi:hypothetical protein
MRDRETFAICAVTVTVGYIQDLHYEDATNLSSLTQYGSLHGALLWF